MEKNKYRYLILSDSTNTYGIVRALGEQGIGSDIFDESPSYGARSKYAEFFEVRPMDRENIKQRLIRRLKELREKGVTGVVFATSDDCVDMLAAIRDDIRPYGVPLIAPEETIRLCNNKRLTVQRAIDVGVPVPESVSFKNVDAFREKEGILRYPVLLKPTKTGIFVRKYKKAVVIENKEEYVKTADEIEARGLGDIPLVLQEYIPGGNECLYNTSFLYGRDGEMKAAATGYKIRQYPPNTGTMTAGRIDDKEELLVYCQKLMEGLDYYGIGSAEFKYDARDGVFKLIEINPRSVLWNYSSAAAGVNLPYLALKDLAGEETGFKRAVVPVVWIYDSLDLVRFTITNRKKYPDHVLSPGQWKKSVRGPKVMALRNKEDLGPWKYFMKETYIDRFFK